MIVTLTVIILAAIGGVCMALFGRMFVGIPIATSACGAYLGIYYSTDTPLNSVLNETLTQGGLPFTLGGATAGTVMVIAWIALGIGVLVIGAADYDFL